ncbi:hypothetical protein NPIL_288711 [Nephila pilipes]|uniref:Uncharacterized protein n=1 Tax=Nephila pilipes TaxID=299642 RepID=A0A8X6TVY3_NEPPI|nr:hypothetical protein NPIL_288711 [Nephila pilipes]
MHTTSEEKVGIRNNPSKIHRKMLQAGGQRRSCSGAKHHTLGCLHRPLTQHLEAELKPQICLCNEIPPPYVSFMWATGTQPELMIDINKGPSHGSRRRALDR